MKLPALAFAAAVSALVLPVSAQAATVVITYTGIVQEGFDATGVFGIVGQDLTGASYTSVYTLDDGVPDVIINDDGTSSSVYGGSNYSVASPITASLTINGVTQFIAGNYIGITAQSNGLPDLASYDIIFHEAQDYTTDTIIETNNLVYNVIQSYENNFITSSNYAASLAYTIQANDFASGAFQFFTGDLTTGIASISATGTLAPQSFTIAPTATSAVPEPATWAMMFAGFGLVGAVSRRRKVTTRVRYALG